jgi:hypothetical protein
MRKNLICHWLATSTVATIVASIVFVASAGGVGGAESEPQDLRVKAERLRQEAEELKRDGKVGRALELRREAEELSAEAEKQQQKVARLPQRNQPRPQENRRQLEQALAEPKDLRPSGKEEKAMKMQRRVQELERTLARFDGPSTEPGGFPPEPPRGRNFRRPAGGEAEMQRLKHLEIAIENLHAAGMHEVAERLTQQAQGMRQNFRPAEGPRRQPIRRAEGELEGLRDEIRDLRQAVRELRARVDQLNRER